jgi:hypothetical protein
MLQPLIVILFAAAAVTGGASDWKVERPIDPMTDKPTCSAYYRGKGNILLTADQLFIGTGYAPESVTLRFGDEPALALRLAYGPEKTARAMIVGVIRRDPSWGPETGRTLNIIVGETKRIRYRSLTVLGTLVEGEIDLRHLPAAYEILNGSKCKVE